MKTPLMQLSNTIVQGFLNMVYPPCCQTCGRSLDLFNRKVLCEICYNSIKRNIPPFCKKCGRSRNYEDDICEDCKTKICYFDATYSACIYDGIIRECIHKFKYRAHFVLEKLFKDLMIEFAKGHIDMQRYNWLIPVPLHRVRHRERTFNQSEILAAHLSKGFKIPLLKSNLIRIRPGKPQMMLSKDKRLEDIKGSFKIKDSTLLKGKSILLIDDVFTTGATVNECSKVLKEAGTSSVEVLTLARSE